jgi:hypothetical protein
MRSRNTNITTFLCLFPYRVDRCHKQLHNTAERKRNRRFCHLYLVSDVHGVEVAILSSNGLRLALID